MKTDSDNTSFLLPWLIFLTIILSLSLLLPIEFGRILQEKNVGFINCPYKQIIGHNCPLCGMTRAFIDAAHLNFKSSFQINPPGFLLFIYLVLYILTGWLFMGYRNKLLIKLLKFNALTSILTIILISWLIKLLPG